MARTFIGELIFRFKDDASARAKTAATSIGGSVTDIERAARRLSVAPFGAKLQRDLEKLGASASEIDKLKASWDRLHASMASRNLSKAAKSNEIAAWSLAARSHFAGLASQIKGADDRTKGLIGSINQLMKLGAYSFAGGSLVYGGGIAVREGLRASASERRERALQHFANLPQSERDQIEGQSQSLAGKYRLTQADVMELMRESRLSMPGADAAFGVSEQLAQAFKMLQLRMGPENALDGLRVLMKGFDNVALTERPEAVKQALDAYVKAQQITGKDMSPEDLAQAIKYARSAGKVFSEDFLFKWMPMMIAEVGGSDTGTQLRAGFDQFIVGRASKASLAKQREYGLRDGDNRLVGQNDFTQNPVKWVQGYVLPALEKRGITKDDPTEMALAIGELTNNRLSSDLILRLIENYAQYERQVAMAEKAIGLEGASSVDALDAFSSFAGLTSSLKNLAGAVVPMETISQGMNSLADAVNTLQQAWRDGDPVARLGIGAAGAGAAFGMWGVGKAIAGLFTAGLNLNAAATSLQAAAVALGGTGGVPGDVPGKGKSKGWSWLAALGSAGAVVASGLIQSGSSREMTPEEKDLMLRRSFQEWLKDHPFIPEPTPRGKYADAADAARVESDRFNFLKQDAREVQDALNITAAPVVDGSQIKAALSDAKALKETLAGIGGAVSAAAQKAKQQMDAEVRRSFSDYGVAP